MILYYMKGGQYMPEITATTRQYHFYLNPDKVSDSYIIEQLKNEKNLSGLVKGLLYSYYKYSNPYGVKLENVTEEKEREVMTDGI